MISEGSKTFEPLYSLDQLGITAFYLGITKLPTLINSPLRPDNKPSFGLYCPNGRNVYYTDFSTGETGNLWNLLMQLWNCSFREMRCRLQQDNQASDITLSESHYNKPRITCAHSKIECKVREWRQYDIDYWESYGITLKWLKYADVYPISHKIITKGNERYVFGADKYAYAYVEFKEGKTTLKIYQPFNKNGFKWSNNHDRSVISLWTKVPDKGDKLCICSSLKDALCLSANLNIPAIAIQGEGYGMSDTAINNLKERYDRIYICLDNDETGLKDGIKLSQSTGFVNVVLPQFEGGKDISDARKVMGKEKFIEYITPLFN